MKQAEFFEQMKASSPDDLARRFLISDEVFIFTQPGEYSRFQEKVRSLIGSVESIAIVGSGNWRYSLNPEKHFREFGSHSDVDVAVVSKDQFNGLWQEMRTNHRKHFYTLSQDSRQRLRRNSENVYAGFISPEWIPHRNTQKQYDYRRSLNVLSDESTQFLKVKMMFFKSLDEATDYYARGFRIARRTIS